MAETTTMEHGYRSRSHAVGATLLRARALAPLALRLTLGLVMVVHGFAKWTSMGAAAQGMEAMGFSPGIFWAVIGGIIEFGGGLALLVGLFTRLAALAFFGEMLVALLTVHIPNGFYVTSETGPGIEFPLVMLGSLFALIILGAGPISIDHGLHRRQRLEARRTEPPVTTGSPKGTRI